MNPISASPSVSITSFKDRLWDVLNLRDPLNERKKSVLSVCEELRSFLEIALKKMKEQGSPHEDFGEQIAHFLMGKRDYLPVGLAEIYPPEKLAQLKTELTEEVKDIVYDVLRTHRYGCFGKKEASEKSIKKIEHFYDELVRHFGIPLDPNQKQDQDPASRYMEKLKQWVQDAPNVEENNAREVAVKRIKECILKNTLRVVLDDLSLTTSPPLPEHFSRLDHFSSVFPKNIPSEAAPLKVDP